MVALYGGGGGGRGKGRGDGEVAGGGGRGVGPKSGKHIAFVMLYIIAITSAFIATLHHLVFRMSTTLIGPPHRGWLYSGHVGGKFVGSFFGWLQFRN